MSEQNQNTAIARKQEPGLKGFLADPRRLKNLATYARNNVNPATMINLACFAAGQDEWLAKCRPETFYTALIVAAQLGLEPSGVRGEAYLVPYKGRVTLIPGYRGLIKLALRSQAVRQIYAHLVYEGDDFVVTLGDSVGIHHRPMMNSSGPREVIAAYAVAVMANGSKQVEYMDRYELDRIRSFAAEGRGGKDGPAYSKWADQMMRKAPVRRLCKFLPLGDDYFLAAKLDELNDDGKPEQIASFIDLPAEDVLDVEESPPPSRIQQAAERASKDAPRGTGTGAAPASPKWRPVNSGLESAIGNWSLRVEKSGEGFAWVATTQDGEIAEGAATDIESAKRAAEAATTRVGP